MTPGHLDLSAVESDPAVTEVSTPDTSTVTEENSRLALDRGLHYPGLASSLDSRKDLVFRGNPANWSAEIVWPFPFVLLLPHEGWIKKLSNEVVPLTCSLHGYCTSFQACSHVGVFALPVTFLQDAAW